DPLRDLEGACLLRPRKRDGEALLGVVEEHRLALLELRDLRLDPSVLWARRDRDVGRRRRLALAQVRFAGPVPGALFAVGVDPRVDRDGPEPRPWMTYRPCASVSLRSPPSRVRCHALTLAPATGLPSSSTTLPSTVAEATISTSIVVVEPAATAYFFASGSREVFP